MDNIAQEVLEIILKSSNFNSLLDYYGQYYICFNELGSEVPICKEHFDYLCSLVDNQQIVRAE